LPNYHVTESVINWIVIVAKELIYN
jgi:hypothetical protein